MRRSVGGVVAVFLSALAACGGADTSDVTAKEALVSNGGGHTIRHDGDTPLGTSLHRSAPALVLRKGAKPIQLDAISYVDAPAAVEVAPAVCYHFADTHNADALGWVGSSLLSSPQAVSHPATTVTVTGATEPSDWCGLTVIAHQPGSYALKHVRIDYHDSTGRHEQDFTDWGLDFTAM